MSSLRTPGKDWLPLAVLFVCISLAKVRLDLSFAVGAAFLTTWYWPGRRSLRQELPAAHAVASWEPVAWTRCGKNGADLSRRKNWRLLLCQEDLWLAPRGPGFDFQRMRFVSSADAVRIPRLDIVMADRAPSGVCIRYVEDGRAWDIVLATLPDGERLLSALNADSGARHLLGP